MKKNKTFFGVLLIMAAMSISACTMMPTRRSSQQDEPEVNSWTPATSIDNRDPRIVNIYEMYLASGGNLSYEEWLASVRGKDGKDGHSPEVTIGDNGNWFIDGNDTGVKAEGEQGEKGNDGDKGDTGDKGDQGDKGDTGKSAYEIYKETHLGYNKSEEEWLDDLVNGRLGEQTSHTVKFNTGGGTEVADQAVLHGEKVNKPADPTRTGYIFKGWTYLDEPWSFAGYVVTGDMTLVAVWEAIDYVAVFKNDDGTVLETVENLHYGETATYSGETPVKPNPEDHYLYTFTGWDKALTVDGDVEFVAQYSKEYAPYEDRYLDAEGNLLYNRFFSEDSSTRLVFGNKTIEQEDGRYYLEAENAKLYSGLRAYNDYGHGGGCVGDLDGGRYMKFHFNLNNKMTALLYSTVSNTYSRFNELMTITVNGKELVIEDDVQAPGTHMWEDFQEALVGKVYLQEGQNEILVTCKCGGYNTDYIALKDLGFDLSQEGVDLPTKANEGTLKYQFKEWKLASDTDNVYTYTPVFSEATIGLEFNKVKVDVYHGSAKDVVVPEIWDGYTITEIGQNSFGSTDVETVVLPETITYIGDNAFNAAQKLKSINFPSSLTSIGTNAFQNCISLENAELNEGLVEIWYHAFESSGLKQVIVPSTVERIHDNVFGGLKADFIYVPATVTYIEWNAFWSSDNYINTIYCEREYRPSTFDVSWNHISNVVWGYKGMLEENGYKFAISQIEGVSSATLVSVDKSIVNANVPSSINEIPVTNVSAGAFMGNTVIQSVVLPEGITKIPTRFFSGCSNLVSATIPNTVTEIGEAAFADCKKLTSFEMPDSVDTIGRYVFGGCYSLASVKLSNSLTALSDQLFWDCDNLKHVEIPEGVTYIPGRTFDNLDKLVSVVMPSTIEKIDNEAFTYSWNINTIFCKCTETQWNNIMATYSHDYDNLYMAVPYFYSETAPTDYGDYWHYVDGVPTVW